MMPNINDISRVVDEHFHVAITATDTERELVCAKANEVFQAVASEHGLGGYLEAYDLSEMTPLGELSRPAFENFKLFLNEL